MNRDDVLAIVDKAIEIGEMIALITPWGYDDTAIRFIKWARTDKTFLDWIDAMVPPAPTPQGVAMMPLPSELANMYSRFQSETGTSADGAHRVLDFVKRLMGVVKFAVVKQAVPVHPAPSGESAAREGDAR